MKQLQPILFAILAVLAVISTACIQDDFTTSGTDTLEFSTDTLAFDTIFTEVGTPTKSFVIRNRHSKMLNISSIKLKGNAAGKFYLNVDGQSGTEFNNVEIRGNDSIFVFVEAYINATDKNNPLEISDAVECVTNGVAQDVIITAWGQDVTRVHGGTITADTRYTADRPYVIFDTLKVAKGATLTIDPGATLYFHDKASMKIDGTLIAAGTQEKPINLRGDRLGNVVADITYDIMSGQWGEIRFGADSYGNEMRYVLMRSSSAGIQIDSTGIEQRKLHLFNSVLHNSSGSVLTARYAWIDAEGTEFSDAKDAVVDLTGGKVNMVQCTFANYYLFSAISGSIVNINYLLPADKKTLPLMVGYFDNCIIYGNTSELNQGDLSGSSVYFRYTLFKSKGSDDANFISCKWGADPLFYTDRENYIFDYRLRNKSDAIAIGSVELCPEAARVDRYGVSRVRSGGIDMGAYTWVENTDENNATN